MRRLYNFFNLRWTDGYSHVSDAPAEVIVDLEAALAQQSVAASGATFATRRAWVGGYHDASLGILKFDVEVAGRRCSYNHVLVLASGYAPLTSERWNLIVHGRYGTDAEDRIRTMYERLARIEKVDGRHALDPLTIRPEDVASLAAAADGSPPAAPERGAQVAPNSSPPTRAPGARVPAWTLVGALAITAAFAIAWITQRTDAARRPGTAIGSKPDRPGDHGGLEQELRAAKGENARCHEQSKAREAERDACLRRQTDLGTRLDRSTTAVEGAIANAREKATTLEQRNTELARKLNDTVNDKLSADEAKRRADLKLEELRVESERERRKAAEARDRFQLALQQARTAEQQARAAERRARADLSRIESLKNASDDLANATRQKLREACKTCGDLCAYVCTK